MVCRLDRNDKLDDSPQDKKQKAATTLLRDELSKKDFAGPISLRSSMKLASRASRPGLTDGFLRTICNGVCTAQRFHTEGDEQMSPVGCPHEPCSLSHYNECPLLYNLFIFFLVIGYCASTEKPSSP